MVEELEVVKEVHRVVETTGEELSSKTSYWVVSDAAIAEAKAEEELGQMIASVPNSSSKVDKVWDLHSPYKWVQIGRVQGHNQNFKCFHTLSWDEQLDDFVTNGQFHFYTTIVHYLFLYKVMIC